MPKEYGLLEALEEKAEAFITGLQSWQGLCNVFIQATTFIPLLPAWDLQLDVLAVPVLSLTPHKLSFHHWFRITSKVLGNAKNRKPGQTGKFVLQ